MKTRYIFRVLYWAIPALLIYDTISIFLHISIHLLDAPPELQPFSSFGVFLFGQILEGLMGFFILVLEATLRVAIVFLFVNRFKYATLISLIFSIYVIANLAFSSVLALSYSVIIASGAVVVFSSILIIVRIKK